MGKFTPHPDKTDTRTAGRVRTAIWLEETAAERMLDSLSFGKGDVWGVLALDHPLHQDGEDPDKPEHAVCIAITGNGPASEANANHLARVWNADEETTNLRAQLEEARGEVKKAFDEGYSKCASRVKNRDFFHPWDDWEISEAKKFLTKEQP